MEMNLTIETGDNEIPNQLRYGGADIFLDRLRGQPLEGVSKLDTKLRVKGVQFRYTLQGLAA